MPGRNTSFDTAPTRLIPAEDEPHPEPHIRRPRRGSRGDAARVMQAVPHDASRLYGAEAEREAPEALPGLALPPPTEFIDTPHLELRDEAAVLAEVRASRSMIRRLRELWAVVLRIPPRR